VAAAIADEEEESSSYYEFGSSSGEEEDSENGIMEIEHYDWKVAVLRVVHRRMDNGIPPSPGLAQACSEIPLEEKVMIERMTNFWGGE
jgi:hypothetical protein